MTLYARQQKRHRCITLSSKPAHRFLRRQVRWSGIPISLRIFYSFLWSTQGKALAWSMKQNIFGIPCFLYDPMDVDNLISGSSAFSKTSLNIWKFMVHILLKTGLENFDHYFTSMWDECSCVVVWVFFSIALLACQVSAVVGEFEHSLALPFFWIGKKSDLF